MSSTSRVPQIWLGPYSDGAIWLAYVMLVLMAVFWANFFTPYLVVITIISALMLVSGHLTWWTRGETPERQTVTAKQKSEVLLGTVFALVSFVGAWLAAPAAFGLPAQELRQLSVSADLSTALGFDAVFSAVQAVSEEVFFRFVIVNRVATLFRRIPALAVPAGVGASGIFFWIFHLPRYWNDPRAQALIFVSGVVTAYVDFRTGMVLTSMLAHVLWNLASVGMLAVTHPAAMAVQMIPVAGLVGVNLLRPRKPFTRWLADRGRT